jgi:hypothetical protein
VKGKPFMRISVLKAVLAPAIVVTLNFAWILAARADPGVFDDRIVFGQSAALKGPAAALGLGMRDGILAGVSRGERRWRGSRPQARSDLVQ